MSGQASRLGAAEVVIGDLDHSRVSFEQVSAVTPADLRRILTTYLVPSRRTAISLNPENASATTPLAPLAAGGVPDFSEVRLANGARLLLQRDPRLPNVHFRLVMQGGPLAEPTGKRGATSLLATMLTKDTKTRTAAQVAEFIESVGGVFHPVAGNNSIGLAVEVLPTDIDRAIDVLTQAMLAPAFLRKTFDQEREAQIASLQQDDDDVVTLARKRLRQLFFGAHPLALDAQGDKAGVGALTPADLGALHRKLSAAGNVVLAVAGDFDPRKLTPKLKTFLAKLPRGSVDLFAGRGSAVMPAQAGEFSEQQPREQAVVLQAFTGPSVHDADFYVSEVADELFSGMASRLFERVREEKGLAYFVRSGRVVGLDCGMFYFFAGTQPGKEREVLVEIDAEIERVQAGRIEAAELARCQTRLKAARRQSMQSNSSRAMQAALNALQGHPINDWKNYDGKIDAVTIDALADFARRRFQRERRTQLVVRP